MELQNIQYTRKSTEDKGRQVQSHDDQTKENYKMAELHGDVIQLTFRDSKSAKKPYQRPEFAKMMELVFDNGIRHLYCWRVNRLARNMLEAGMVIEALQTGQIQKIITPEREYLPTDNVVLIAVDFGIAKEDIKKLSADVKRGLNGKVSKGWRPGTAVIGYLNDKYGEKGSKILFKDPERFDKVNHILHEGLTGKYSYMDLVRMAGEIKLTPRSRRGSKGVLSKSTVIGMIKNPFYAGRYWFNGELQQGKHDTMITWEEYERLQILFRRKDKSRNFKHDNKYNGLFKCGVCGFSITPEPAKKKIIKSTGEARLYKYWRCTHKSTEIECNQRSIVEEELTRQVNEYLEGLEMDRDFIKWGMQHIETYSKGEIQFRQTIQKEFEKQFEDASFSLDRLTQSFFSPSNASYEILTESEYIKRKKELKEGKDKAFVELNNISKRQDQFIEKIEDDLQFCEKLLFKFNHGENEDKKMILNRLGRTMIIKDGKIHIESKSPYLQFINLKKEVEANPSWLGLNESNKDEDIQMFTKIQTVISGIRESNP